MYQQQLLCSKISQCLTIKVFCYYYFFIMELFAVCVTKQNIDKFNFKLILGITDISHSNVAIMLHCASYDSHCNVTIKSAK